MRGWRLGGARGRWKDRTCVLPPRRNFGAGRQPRWKEGGRGTGSPSSRNRPASPGTGTGPAGGQRRGRDPLLSFAPLLHLREGKPMAKWHRLPLWAVPVPSPGEGWRNAVGLIPSRQYIPSLCRLNFWTLASCPPWCPPRWDRCRTAAGSPSVTGRGVTLSKAPAGSSILQLSPGPVLKHQLIPQHWFRASQTGRRVEGGGGQKRGEIQQRKGGDRQGPSWGSLVPGWCPLCPKISQWLWAKGPRLWQDLAGVRAQLRPHCGG